MRSHKHRRSPRSLRLRLEALESRSLLSTYTITNFPTGFNPAGLNNNGQVVGNVENTSTQTTTPFLWSNGTLTPLTGLPANTAAVGINDSEQVIGVVNLGGVLLNANTGAVTSLPIAPVAINDAGQIAGSNSAGQAAFYQNGTVVVAPTSTPTGTITATGISSNGLVSAYIAGDPLIWNPATGQITDLGGNGAEAFGVNASGQATGFDGLNAFGPEAFLYSNGVLEDIGGLGGPNDQS
jgi:probable HAF family extracellular repeat protein